MATFINSLGQTIRTIVMKARNSNTMFHFPDGIIVGQDILDPEKIRAVETKVVSFSENIVLDRNKDMGFVTVSAGIHFNVDKTKSIINFKNTVKLIANATDVPVFDGFIKDTASDTYSNVAGNVNVITFWYDGFFHFYSIKVIAKESVTPSLTYATRAANEIELAITNPTALSVTSYTLMYKKDIDTVWTTITFVAPALTKVVNSLVASTVYQFKISASDGVNNSLYSSVLNVQTTA